MEHIMAKLTRKEIIKVHKFVMNRRKNNCELGQRSLSRDIKLNYDFDVSENTISGWIHRKIIPFANEKTQFKSKSRPKRVYLKKYYSNEGLSAQKIAKKYHVSTATVIKWLHYYKLPVRTHRESMNTSPIKEELRKRSLLHPTKSYCKLTPEKSYLLGVLCGDAYIDDKKVVLEIKSDKEFIDRFCKSIEKVYGLSYEYHKTSRKTLIVAISCEILVKDLLNYGNFRTFTWNVPRKVVKSYNKEVIINFLQGVYDSEGSFSSYCIKMASASKMGIIRIVQLLKLLGIHSKVRRNRKYFEIEICRKPNLALFKKLINFTISRKRERLENPYRRGW